MKRIVVVLLAGVVVAGIWLVARRGPTAGPASVLPPVKVAEEVVAEGRVVPVRSASLSLSTGGVVSEILVAEGDRVAAEQVLVRLATARQLAARVAQAEAGLAQAQARLAELRAGARPEEIASARAVHEASQQRVHQAETALRLAQLDLHRTEQLYGDGAVARGDVDRARAAYDSARADLDAVRADLRRAQAQLDLIAHGVRPETLAAADAELAAAVAARREAVVALADAELRAPFAGAVAAVEVKVGEFVPPGVPVVRLADTSSWIVETTDLTELGVARVREGDPATITFDALPGLTLDGRVTGIRTHGENRQGDIVYRVTIRPERHEPRLYWNMTATVAIAGVSH
jgi:HlyD family secretion protein